LSHRIPIARPDLGKEELENVDRAVKSGWVSSKGPFVDEFEEGLSDYIGVRHALAVCNGTVALHLALIALGIGSGNEVLVPSLSFVAVANAVAYTGAKPVFIDSHPDYWCIDPEGVKKNITRRTKAVVLVHLYGHPCDIQPILEIAHSKDLCVVEDCAEAHGAEYKGKKVGSFGDVSCFSFYGNKIITTGEGGMCLTNNRDVAEKMRILRGHGMNPKKRYWHDVVGFNYRMTNLQAALGVAQLRKIGRLVERKREIAKKYRELLGEDNAVIHAPEMSWARNVYWLYSILLDASLRERVMKALGRQGIETRPFFYPIHTMPPHKRSSRLPTAERLSARGMNLPSGPRIGNEEVYTVASSVKRALKSRRRNA
jgi:perosamine synthetase